MHDEARPDPGLAFALSRLALGPYEPTPVGIFRAVRSARLRLARRCPAPRRQSAERPRRPGEPAPVRHDLDGGRDAVAWPVLTGEPRAAIQAVIGTSGSAPRAVALSRASGSSSRKTIPVRASGRRTST